MEYLEKIENYFYPVSQPPNEYVAKINSPGMRGLDGSQIVADDGRFIILNDHFKCCLRRTPDGQPKVDDIVSPGDLIKSWDYCYGERGYTEYIVEAVSKYYYGRNKEIERFCLRVSHTYEEVQSRRRIDGEMSESQLCYLNDYVAQDGRILALFCNDCSAIEVAQKRYLIRKSRNQLLLF